MYYISNRHKKEFAKSAILPSIAIINFESFDPDNGDGETVDALTSHLLQFVDAARTNTGKLCGNATLQNLFTRFYDGGYICHGCDPLTGLEMNWGQIKPNNPRTDEKGKIIKYESPYGRNTNRVYFPSITMEIWGQIAVKHSTPFPLIKEVLSQYEINKLFWDWVIKNNHIPLLITEGHKKACSLISAGYVAIALNGIWGFRYSITKEEEEKGIKRYLLDDMQMWEDRSNIVIVFDSDSPEKISTIKSVNASIRTLADYLYEQNNKITKLIWDSKLGKGVDDLISNFGVSYFDKLFSTGQKKVFRTVSPCPEIEPDQDDYEEYLKYQENLEYIDNVVPIFYKEERKQQWLETKDQTEFNHWLKTRKLTANIDLIDISIGQLNWISEAFSVLISFYFQSIIEYQIYNKYKDLTKILLNLLTTDLTPIKNRYQYFDYPTPKSGTALCIKSGLGSGKTHRIARMVTEIDKTDNCGWILLGHRNNILIQTIERYDVVLKEQKLEGFYHLHRDNAYMHVSDPYSKLALCPDSMGHFQDHQLEGKWVIIDETISVVCHYLMNNTLGGKLPKVIDRIVWMLQHCKGLIIADGNLNDDVVNYLRELCPHLVINVVTNSYKSNTFDIEIVNGVAEDRIMEAGEESTEEENTMIIRNHRSPIIQRILQEKRPQVMCDSRKECEALGEMLAQQGKKGLVITSKTTNNPDVKEFMIECNNPEYWEREKLDFLICSPSVDAGLDISIRNIFTHQYVILFGVLKTDAETQMIARVRDPNVKRTVWCANTPIDNDNNSAYFERAIARNYEDMIRSDAMLSLDDPNISDRDYREICSKMMRQFLDHNETPHYRYYRKLKAKLNYEKHNQRKCLIHALEEAGHNVTIKTYIGMEEYREVMSQLGEAKEELADREATQLFNAEDISIQEARLKKDSFDLTWEDRCKVKKALIKDKLPGIHLADVWSKDFIKDMEKNNWELIRQSELLYMVQHPEISKYISQLKWVRSLTTLRSYIPNSLREYVTLRNSRLTEGEISIRSNFLKVWTLINCGILTFLEEGREWTADDDEVLAFAAKCKKRENALAIGMTVGKQDPIRFLHKLLKNLFGLKAGMIANRSIGTDRIKSYGITNWNEEARNTIYNIVEEKLTNTQLNAINWSSLLNPETLEINRKIVLGEGGGSINYTLDREHQKEDLIPAINGLNLTLGAKVQILNSFNEYEIVCVGSQKVFLRNCDTGKMTFAPHSMILG